VRLAENVSKRDIKLIGFDVPRRSVPEWNKDTLFDVAHLSDLHRTTCLLSEADSTQHDHNREKKTWSHIRSS
jgi:hypothetical protein